eukprot:11605653-Alexandrium_andersonii.AAC.1
MPVCVFGIPVCSGSCCGARLCARGCLRKRFRGAPETQFKVLWPDMQRVDVLRFCRRASWRVLNRSASPCIHAP